MASSFRRSGPLMRNCTSADCAPLPPMLATGWTDVRRLAASGGGVAAYGHERVVHLGYALAYRRGDAVGDHLRRLEARAFRRSQIDLELRLVVLRHEVLVRDHEERRARQQHEHGHARDDGPVRHRPAEYPGVEEVD